MRFHAGALVVAPKPNAKLLKLGAADQYITTRRVMKCSSQHPLKSTAGVACVPNSAPSHLRDVEIDINRFSTVDNRLIMELQIYIVRDRKTPPKTPLCDFKHVY